VKGREIIERILSSLICATKVHRNRKLSEKKSYVKQGLIVSNDHVHVNTSHVLSQSEALSFSFEYQFHLHKTREQITQICLILIKLSLFFNRIAYISLHVHGK
jgi:hypothetical protein